MDKTPDYSELFLNAAKAILNADYILIGAGAGCSKDSGLAVYKDIAKVKAWEKAKLNYMDLCKPDWLKDDPSVFYGFWGHCYNDYKTKPLHEGYLILSKWRDELFSSFYKNKQDDVSSKGNNVINRIELKDMKACFVYTSNVDDLFLRAGWDASHVYRFHGTTFLWQCSKCVTNKNEVMKLPDDFKFQIDKKTMKAIAPSSYPKCTTCGTLLRPNVLMFGDSDWVGAPSNEWYKWKLSVNKEVKSGKKLVIVEIGAGQFLPTVRKNSERMLVEMPGTILIRINPDFPESPIPEQTISLPLGAAEALVQIDKCLEELKKNQQQINA
eukprot:TRINITY_DN6222_c0_g1_i4.p1 TRINITY_DN6222_c0_g1~~TRINITY_DN6222_c0_g1_i4.p1  ORF type:complete len:325 (+),score=50.28 TRINITY_DN6222_c0_g1_i4:59-1033(+)